MSWTLIEHQALSSSAASVTLGSGGTIPQSFKTLKLVVSARSSDTGNIYKNISVTINGSSTGYSERIVYGTGSATGSNNTAATNLSFMAYAVSSSATASTFANAEITFPNYATSSNKAVSGDSVTENNATDGGLQSLAAGLWSNSAAITSIVLATTGNFVSGSTFSLYGLK